jgi:hypothetical protein
VLTGAIANGPFLPWGPVDLVLRPGDFALMETPDARRGAAFANLCSGLVPLASGSVRFFDRDWSAVPREYADAMRGHIGRLFHHRMRTDASDISARSCPTTICYALRRYAPFWAGLGS